MLSSRRTTGTVLSTASRYGALQKAFNDRLREWYWQRNGGTRFQIWQPPGVVFSRLRKDHWEHGRYVPDMAEWGFEAQDSQDRPLRLVLRALGGHWAIWQARRRTQDNWIVADSDEGHLFNAFYKAMNTFALEAEDSKQSFPNLRLLYVNERHAARFFAPGTLRSVHIHLPWPERTTRPKREALITPKLISDVSDALEVNGELHIVTDDEASLEVACGALTRSRLFDPRLEFPFHSSSVPASYPTADLLRADAAKTLSPDAVRPFFYTRWEKKPPQLPNFRFQGGKGYGDVAQGLLEPGHGTMLPP